MKRSERRLLEEKLRYVAMEEIELDPERAQQMIEQAKANLMRQGAETEPRKASGHRMGRRVLIVSAAAVLIVVLSFGFAVLTPESVSHARGFMRSAAIWVNNTLKLGYVFEEPMERPDLFTGEDATYATLEEAAANIPYPLVYLDDPSLTLRSVSVQQTDSLSKIIISYGDDFETRRIELTPISEDLATHFSDESQTLIPWQGGEMMSWEIDSLKCAITYYTNVEIGIVWSDISYDDFLMLCQTLKVLN